MAECYHNEALRKQRVIDRAAEAREKLEEKKAKVQIIVFSEYAYTQDARLCIQLYFRNTSIKVYK